MAPILGEMNVCYWAFIRGLYMSYVFERLLEAFLLLGILEAPVRS